MALVELQPSKASFKTLTNSHVIWAAIMVFQANWRYINHKGDIFPLISLLELAGSSSISGSPARLLRQSGFGRVFWGLPGSLPGDCPYFTRARQGCGRFQWHQHLPAIWSPRYWSNNSPSLSIPFTNTLPWRHSSPALKSSVFKSHPQPCQINSSPEPRFSNCRKGLSTQDMLGSTIRLYIDLDVE